MECIKGISITNGPPVNKEIIARFDQLDLLRSKYSCELLDTFWGDVFALADNNCPRKFYSWKQSDLSGDECCDASTLSSVYGLAWFYDAETNSGKADVICRSGTKILSYKSNPLLTRNTKILNVAGGHSYVGSELLFAGFFLRLQSFFEGFVAAAQDQVLNANSYSSENNEEKRNVINPRWGVIISGLLFAAGLYFLYQTVFKGEDCLACRIAFLLGAWSAIFIAVWLLVVGSLGWHLWPLTTFNDRPENVLVKAIIIPELELRNVKWHVLGANLVERANDTAHEDTPKAFDRLSMNRTDNVLLLGMVNGGMRGSAHVINERAMTLRFRRTAPATIVSPEAMGPGLPSRLVQ